MIIEPLIIADLCGFVPFYVELLIMFLFPNWRWRLGHFAVLRLWRLFRLAMLVRYSTKIRLVYYAVKRSIPMLWGVLGFMTISVFIFSTSSFSLYDN